MSINHLGLNVVNFEEARDFYLAALKPLGYKVVVSILEGRVLGLGSSFAPDFWLSALDIPTADGSDTRRDTKAPASAASNATQPLREKTGPLHLAFTASNREQVRKFHAAAIAAGGKCNGPPGLRPEYFATYYGAFILDPEGRNIEAVCMKPGFWAEPWGFVGWSIAAATVVGTGSGVAQWMGWL